MLLKFRVQNGVNETGLFIIVHIMLHIIFIYHEGKLAKALYQTKQKKEKQKSESLT